MALRSFLLAFSTLVKLEVRGRFGFTEDYYELQKGLD